MKTARTMKSPEERARKKYLVLRIEAVTWLLYTGWCTYIIIKNGTIKFLGLNLHIYSAMLLFSVVCMMGTVILATVYGLRKKDAEWQQDLRLLCYAGCPGFLKKRLARRQPESDTPPEDVLAAHCHKLSRVFLGLSALLFFGAVVSCTVAASRSPIAMAYAVNRRAEGYHYSASDRLEITFDSEGRPAATEFYYNSYGDFADNGKSVYQNLTIGFDQFINGEKTGWAFYTTEIYLQQKATHSDAYVYTPAVTGPVYDKGNFPKNHGMVVAPFELLGYFSSDDYVGTEEYNGVECDLYKAGVHSTALESIIRHELSRYLALYDYIPDLYQYGFTDGDIIPLNSYMLEEPVTTTMERPGVEMSVWIDKESGLVLRVEIDASPLLIPLSCEFFGLPVFNVRLWQFEFQYSDYGETDIVIPEEFILNTEQLPD